ncbi:unnamed protein product [Mycena citricolor]|uniref:Uncharacterized protein n=1 Tax=Mycena citricolor TaxID=2018698 RepID=A0AAD2HAT2_9AGAR|nr:unnamed protein product [Mycena citricolor]
MGAIASAEMLFAAAPLLKVRVSAGRLLAWEIALADDAPRSTTSAASLSLARRPFVRDTAATRSAGGCGRAMWMSKEWASLSGVVPVTRLDGRGQRACTWSAGSRTALHARSADAFIAERAERGKMEKRRRVGSTSQEHQLYKGKAGSIDHLDNPARWKHDAYSLTIWPGA